MFDGIATSLIAMRGLMTTFRILLVRERVITFRIVTLGLWRNGLARTIFLASRLFRNLIVTLIISTRGKIRDMAKSSHPMITLTGKTCDILTTGVSFALE
jgi:hypothetical protein